MCGRSWVNDETKKADYLCRAKQAEREAEKARSLAGRETWLKIAKIYRELADTSVQRSR